MPNVLLTTRCNLACNYCFAQEKMASDRKHMPIGNVQKVIQFLKQSNYPIFRVMGGEPTLHPKFTEIIRLALQEGLRVDLLSNATWSEGCRDLFSRISPKHLLFLLNIDHPDNYPASLWARIERNLAGLMGRKGITMSFNIFEKEPRYQYILDLASRYGIHRIRMSFSLPVLGGQNTYLPVDELHEIAPFILKFKREAEAIGVSIQLDNAIPLCIFSRQQIGELVLDGVLDFSRNARCEPIVDIGPDLTVWSCFCLSKLDNRKLDEFKTLQDVLAYFRSVLSRYQGQIYPMKACYDCKYRELWDCQGGCLTYTVMKAEQAAANCPMEKDERDPWQSGMFLDMAEDVIISHYVIPQETYVISKSSTGCDVEIGASFQPFFDLLDGQHTVEEVIEGYIGDDDKLSDLDRFTRVVMKESLNDLLVGLLNQGYLIQNSSPAEKKQFHLIKEANPAMN